MKISKLHITLDEKTLVDINLTLQSSLALVGQSGSGKSLTLKALLGMLPDTMKLTLDMESTFPLVAGTTVAFVPQNPFTALSPLTKIKKQFFREKEKVVELFQDVGLELDLLERFAPELSGGQLQRVILAIALEANPKLILLDEPTTALDPETRVMILALLKKLQEHYGFKILFVTHDISAAVSLCEDICVLQHGRVVEAGDLKTIMQNPKEQYTKELIASNFANREFRK
ncbi:MAG: ATP-binding cassette domain-containing protein [Sulfurimonadaceae bacterium]|jgi:peptide/nickel transport system ATP-binding protein|nr:ATP-binding cassette domain-containing protein [Sulfurimonadaceae bacterium]